MSAPEHSVAPQSAKREPAAACGPLGQLNQYIRAARTGLVGVGLVGESPDHDELVSARRFKQAWEMGRTQDEVEHAVTRAPVNAGPLNSHVLVLQSLRLMQELSPDYLRRFLLHVGTLQWLDRASEKYPRQQAGQTGAAKTARRPRQKK